MRPCVPVSLRSHTSKLRLNSAAHAVEYQGEWISFEEYLKRRFNIGTTHGMSPAEARKQIYLMMQSDRNA